VPPLTVNTHFSQLLVSEFRLFGVVKQYGIASRKDDAQGGDDDSSCSHGVFLSFLLVSLLFAENLPLSLIVAVDFASILKANASDVGDATALLMLNGVFVHGDYLSLFLSDYIIPHGSGFVKGFLKINL
jgi:hypothetical protein